MQVLRQLKRVCENVIQYASKRLKYESEPSSSESQLYFPELQFPKLQLETTLLQILCGDPMYLIHDLVKQIILEYLLWIANDPRTPFVQTVSAPRFNLENRGGNLVRGDNQIYVDTKSVNILSEALEKLKIKQPFSPHSIHPNIDVTGPIYNPTYCALCHRVCSSIFRYSRPCGETKGYDIQQCPFSLYFRADQLKCALPALRCITENDMPRVVLCFHPTNDERAMFFQFWSRWKSSLVCRSGTNTESIKRAKLCGPVTEIPLTTVLGPRLRCQFAKYDNNAMSLWGPTAGTAVNIETTERYQWSNDLKWVRVSWTHNGVARLCAVHINTEKAQLEIEMVGPDRLCKFMHSAGYYCWAWVGPDLYSFFWNQDPEKITLRFPPIQLTTSKDWYNRVLIPLPAVQGIASILQINKSPTSQLTVIQPPRFAP
jgi:hypothetical protein